MDPKLLERLKEPDCYPEGNGGDVEVELLQTHLSVICLVGSHAYKLKKPVKLPFADFSTLQLRERVCHDEVRLNRRLCPEVYLGVVPLRKTGEGRWSFREEEGAVVDHAVLMRRLPDDRLMDRMLDGGEVREDQIRILAEMIAAFHQRSEATPEVLKAGSPENQRRAILDNFEEVGRFVGKLFDPGLLAAVRERAVHDLEERMPELARRSAAGRIVDGHGDLHSGNIFLTDPPTVFDCIEFNSSFRCGDVASECAFLVMDLTYRGHADLARVFLASYSRHYGDDEMGGVLPMFVSYRAMVRAKVAALKAEAPEVGACERKEARESASRHLLSAAAGALGGERLVILFCGLPGSGKSTVARALSGLAGWPVFSSDEIRKELAGVPAEERLPDQFYTPDFSQRVYAALAQRACSSMDGPACADANFPSRKSRAAMAERAKEVGVSVVIVWVRAEERLVLQRLARRVEGGRGASDAGIEVYRKVEARFEAPRASEGYPIIPIDSAQPVEKSLCMLLRGLLEHDRKCG